MTYADEVLADSPVVYLKLDETSGTTAVDSSGNGNDFTYGSGVSLAAGTNDLGSTVAGSGTAEIASISPPPSSFHDFAIECWVTLDDTSQSGPFVKIGGAGGYVVGVGGTNFTTTGNQLLSAADGSGGVLGSGYVAHCGRAASGCPDVACRHRSVVRLPRHGVGL